MALLIFLSAATPAGFVAPRYEASADWLGRAVVMVAMVVIAVRTMNMRFFRIGCIVAHRRKLPHSGNACQLD